MRLCKFVWRCGGYVCNFLPPFLFYFFCLIIPHLIIPVIASLICTFLHLSALPMSSSWPRVVRHQRWRFVETALGNSASTSTMKASWLRYLSAHNWKFFWKCTLKQGSSLRHNLCLHCRYEYALLAVVYQLTEWYILCYFVMYIISQKWLRELLQWFENNDYIQKSRVNFTMKSYCSAK